MSLSAFCSGATARALALLAPNLASRFGFWYRRQSIRHPRWLAPIAWEKTVTLPRDIRMRVPFREVHGMSFILSGSYEPELTERISATLAPGDIFIDVGANMGFFSILASKAVGEEGLVVAFEPSPGNLELLTHNLGLNGCSNVALVSAALSDREQLARLSVPPFYNNGVCSLRDPTSTTAFGFTLAATMKFDSLSPNVVPRSSVRLVKIDTEGHELDVLRGMRSLLEGSSPLQIAIELSPEWYSVRELSDFMAIHGFHGEWFSDTGWQPLTSDSMPLTQCNGWFTRN